MGLIRKLLGRGEALEQEPETEMVSKAEYLRLEQRFNDAVADYRRVVGEKQDMLLERIAARPGQVRDAAELAQWRQYGQMRDPQTGRLVPRVKAEVE